MYIASVQSSYLLVTRNCGGFLLNSTDLLHVNTVCIRPHVVGVVLDSLPQGTGDLVKPDELAYLLHLRVISRCCRIQPRYDGGNITKYGSVK